MRTIAPLLLAAAVALIACGAQPNQPVLANVPRPDPGVVGGAAAAAAAAITLADPDAAARKAEKNEPTPKQPIEVKENVPASVLDRLDKAEATKATPDAASAEPARPKPPATKAPPRSKQPVDLKLSRDPVEE